MLFSGGYKVCLDNIQPLTAIFLDFVSLITIFLFVLHIALSHTLFFVTTQLQRKTHSTHPVHHRLEFLMFAQPCVFCLNGPLYVSGHILDRQ